MNTAEVRIIERGTRKLGYALEFSQTLGEHPGALKTAMQLAQRAIDEYCPSNIQSGVGELQWNKDETRFDVIKVRGQSLAVPQPYENWASATRGVLLAEGGTYQDDKLGLNVTILGKSKRDYMLGMFNQLHRLDDSAYFRISLGEQAFFVKKSTKTINTGFSEFRDSIKVSTILRNIADIQVVDAQLGYESQQQSWFVSRWENLESASFYPFDLFMGNTPSDYGEYISWMDERKQRYLAHESKVKATVEDIKTRLKKVGVEIRDIEANLFYNPFTEKYFLLDVTTKDANKLGQPHR